MTATIAPIRNAGFQQMLEILQNQQARKIDLVVPAAGLRFTDGQLQLEGLDPIFEEEGLTDPNGLYTPTQVFDDSVAERLDIHPTYLRRLREGRSHAKTGKLIAEPRLDLYDANVNGLLHGRKPKMRTATPAELADDTVDKYRFEGGSLVQVMSRPGVAADKRKFLVRLFRADNESQGIARALLSDRFARMDNLDGLMAMLQGIQDAGVDPGTLKISGDLSETRMYVNVQAPEILTLAPKLLEGYRSPFDTGVEGAKRQTTAVTFEERLAMGEKMRQQGRLDNLHRFFEPGTEPILFAGFKLVNSEVGNGRWQIVPTITVARCSNGLTFSKDAFARTHVGSKLEEGHVEWSADTQTKELALVTAQTRDLVKMALSQEYLDTKIAELEERSDKVIEEPEKAIEVLGQRLKFSKEEQAGILRHFLMGGQGTAGGILNAVTSYSQTLESPDAAYELDAKAVPALEMAAALR